MAGTPSFVPLGANNSPDYAAAGLNSQAYQNNGEGSGTGTTNVNSNGQATGFTSSTTGNTTPMQTTTALRTTANTNGAALDAKLTKMNTPSGDTVYQNGKALVYQNGTLVSSTDGQPPANPNPANPNPPNPDNPTPSASKPGSETGADGGAGAASTDAGTTSSTDAQVAAIQSAAKTKIASITSQLSTIQANADAASAALIESIKTMFNGRIADMEESNAGVNADVTAIGNRTGRARYAPVLQAGILSDSEQQGVARVTELQGQELQLVAQANQARAQNDLTGFNDQMDQINKVDDDMTAAITKLHADAMDQQKFIEQKKTDDLNAQKTKLDMELSTSKAAAPGLIDELSKLTDPAAKADLIAATAKELGVDPTVLTGDVESAASTQEKASLDIANIKSEIAARNNKTTGSSSGGATGGNLTVNKQGLLDTGSLTTLGAALTTGGTIGGQNFAPKGSDGFVDPNLYDALYTNIKSNYGAAAAQQFLTKYDPKKYINPSNATNTGLDPAITALVAAGGAKTGAVAPGI